jgi:pSer/pThr/pTyr-binding forkhead associated (FHA) protein
MAQLTMRRGPEPGKIYMLSQETIQIGRGARNDIVIIDNEVSREHCRFVRRDYGYELFDLESSNGTFVNGQRVEESWALPHECIVELGDSITLAYRIHPDDIDMSTHQVVIEKEAYEESALPSFLVVTVSSQPLPSLYPLEGELIEVGRGTTNNVIIVEPEISRQHLKLTKSRHGYIIEDVGSTNGTSLNGVLLKEPQLLHDGDVIRIGTTIIIRYTTNPQVFMSKTPTASLGEADEAKEPTKIKRTIPAQSLLEHPLQPTMVGPGIEPGALVDHVLMIYARSQWETVVAPIVDRLYGADIPVWVEQYLAQGGDDWMVAFEQAKTECWLLIVIVSKDSMEMDYIQKIWRHFQNREKPIILVMSEEVERLPFGANRAYKIRYNRAKSEDSLSQVVQAIRQLRSV